MALIECPECNKQVSDQAISCPHCGALAPKLPLKDNEFHCPSCRQPTLLGFSFCVHCGEVNEHAKEQEKMLDLWKNAQPLPTESERKASIRLHGKVFGSSALVTIIFCIVARNWPAEQIVVRNTLAGIGTIGFIVFWWTGYMLWDDWSGITRPEPESDDRSE